MSKKAAIVLCLIAFAAGWMISDAAPAPKERPVLKALARIAKAALWLAAFAEPPPEPHVDHKSVMVDANGIAQINHARGW